MKLGKKTTLKGIYKVYVYISYSEDVTWTSMQFVCGFQSELAMTNMAVLVQHYGQRLHTVTVR